MAERAERSKRFLAEAKKAQYFHCAMHCLNLCTAQAVKIPAIQHAQDVIKEMVSFFKSTGCEVVVIVYSHRTHQNATLGTTQGDTF
jgi:hypothetical protein